MKVSGTGTTVSQSSSHPGALYPSPGPTFPDPAVLVAAGAPLLRRFFAPGPPPAPTPSCPGRATNVPPVTAGGGQALEGWAAIGVAAGFTAEPTGCASGGTHTTEDSLDKSTTGPAVAGSVGGPVLGPGAGPGAGVGTGTGPAAGPGPGVAAPSRVPPPLLFFARRRALPVRPSPPACGPTGGPGLGLRGAVPPGTGGCGGWALPGMGTNGVNFMEAATPGVYIHRGTAGAQQGHNRKKRDDCSQGTPRGTGRV